MKNFRIKQKRALLGSLLAIISALIVEHFFSYSHQLWVPVATVVMLLGVLRVTALQALLRFIILLLVSMVVATLFLPWEHMAVLHDILLGAVIGLFALLLFFPARLDEVFCQAMTEVLQIYSMYLVNITEMIWQVSGASLGAEKNKRALEAVQLRKNFYPEWVFTGRFNPAMQKGHRHFLISVERVGQILYAMHYAARQLIHSEQIGTLEEPIKSCEQEVKHLLQVIAQILESKILQNPVTNLSENLSMLEHAFQQEAILPFSEYSASEGDLYLAAFIYGFRDLQKELFKLTSALR